jgi:hypothetical protein
MLERTDEGVCPYIVVLYSTEQITCLLVNQSTRQLELITILNYTWASALFVPFVSFFLSDIKKDTKKDFHIKKLTYLWALDIILLGYKSLLFDTKKL